jgi:hypothetical protein
MGGHLQRMGEMRNVYNRDHSEDPSVDGRIILKC